MKKLALIGIAVVVAGLTFAGTAGAKPTSASPQVPSGMTAAEYHALMVRSQGLNDLYGVKPLPSVTLEQGQNQRFAVSQPARKVGLTKAEYDALMARSEGLNRMYGLGIESLTLERGSTDRFSPGNPAKDELVAFTPSETSTGFAWDDAGIGAGVGAGALALLAVVGTGIVAIRHRGHGPLGTS
jgi:hypothetical protein